MIASSLLFVVVSLAGCDGLDDKDYLKQRLGPYYIDLDAKLTELAEKEAIVPAEALAPPGGQNQWQKICTLYDYAYAGETLSRGLGEEMRPILETLKDFYIDENYFALVFIGDQAEADRIAIFDLEIDYEVVGHGGRKLDRRERQVDLCQNAPNTKFQILKIKAPSLGGREALERLQMLVHLPL